MTKLLSAAGILSLLTACTPDPRTAQLEQIPLCSSGERIVLDAAGLKARDPEAYSRLPLSVRVFGFQALVCKEDEQ